MVTYVMARREKEKREEGEGEKKRERERKKKGLSRFWHAGKLIAPWVVRPVGRGTISTHEGCCESLEFIISPLIGYNLPCNDHACSLPKLYFFK